MEKPVLKMSKDTRKLFRLQTSEKYLVKKINSTCFEVYTRNLNFKAFVDILGTLISSKSDNYDKVEFYKLQNFCSLLQKEHFRV